jgi:hypothetical protein
VFVVATKRSVDIKRAGRGTSLYSMSKQICEVYKVHVIDIYTYM